MSFLIELVASTDSATDLESFAASSIEAGAAGITGVIISLSSSGAPTNGAAALRVADAAAATSSNASTGLSAAAYFAFRSAIF